MLDLGSGPGSDSGFFLRQGLRVRALDATPAFVEHARANGVGAYLGTFDDVTETAEYDGVYASFSLLHAPRADFPRHLAAIHRALKPGGVLLIIDHSAETGTGIDSVDQLHRIEEAHVYRTLTDLGFELTGQSQVLRSAGDDRRVGVFDEAIRGKTDRFVLAFTAP